VVVYRVVIDSRLPCSAGTTSIAQLLQSTFGC
jgi:hypothetical protein